MSWLSDAHAEWHIVHGRDVTCPLDCGAGEHEVFDSTDDSAYTHHCGAMVVREMERCPKCKESL